MASAAKKPVSPPARARKPSPKSKAARLEIDVSLPLWFSGAQLAKLMGCTVQRIDQLQAEGTLVKVNKKYDIHVNVPLYVERLRKQAAGRVGGQVGGDDLNGRDPSQLDPVFEGARLKKEQADAQALKNDIARGNLVPRDAIEKAFGGVIIVAKNRLETLATRLPQMIHGLTQRDQRIIADDVRSTLKTLVKDGQDALLMVQGKAVEGDEIDAD